MNTYKRHRFPPDVISNPWQQTQINSSQENFDCLCWMKLFAATIRTGSITEVSPQAPSVSNVTQAWAK
jgi:hypothetical protein